MSLHGAKLNRDAHLRRNGNRFILCSTLCVTAGAVLHKKSSLKKNIEQLVKGGNKISCCISAFQKTRRIHICFFSVHCTCQASDVRLSVKKNNRKEYVIQMHSHATPPPLPFHKLKCFPCFAIASQPASK